MTSTTLANIEAERGLLSSAMFSPDGLTRVIRALPPRCFNPWDPKSRDQEPLFSEFRNQEIWESVYELAKADHGVDLVTVASSLNDKGRYQTIGGGAYLSDLCEEMLSTIYIEEYCRIVFEKWKSRQINRLSANLQDGEIRGDAETRSRMLDELAEIKALTFEPKDTRIGQSCSGFLKDWEERRRSDGDPGIRTGISGLDAYTGGARPQELWIVGARTSMGKSCVLLQIAYHAARMGTPVWYLTLEMSQREVMERLISLNSTVPLAAIRDPKKASSYEAKRIQSANQFLSDLPLMVEDKVMDFDEASHSALRAVNQDGAGMIVVDYLQIFKEPKGTRWSRYEMVTHSAKRMKLLAKESGVPVICGAQVSRDTEKRQSKRRKRGDALPRLSDLRESGAIEQDADVVLFLHRHGGEQPPRADLEDPKIQNEALFSLAKQRNGGTGWWPMMFDPERVTFRNVRMEEAA